MVIDAETGLLTWTPTANQLGSHAFSILADDGRGGRGGPGGEIQVVATAPNDPPVINSQPRLRARVWAGVRLRDRSCTIPTAIRFPSTWTPVPTGMTVDPSGVVRWQPAAELLGTSSRSRSASKTDAAAVATQEFELKSSRRIPTRRHGGLDAAADRAVGRTYRYDAVAAIRKAIRSSGAWIQAPTGMSIDPLRGTVRWTPAADQTGRNRSWSKSRTCSARPASSRLRSTSAR
jgi:hypothetical protein